MKNPVLLIIAGPNGAGKTTVTVRLKKEKWSEDVEYLNPDDVAQERFGDWNSEEAVRSAATWTTARREELLAHRQGLGFETVFSAPDKIDFLARARAAGYFVRMLRINAGRVAGRFMSGGHSVPIEKIVNRYTRSMINLGDAIRLANRVYIYDNSVDDRDAELCARTQDGLLRKVYAPLPPWVADATESLPRHLEFADLRA
ncbi:zeta toxin family protein [Pendulispora rubella]|uniref:Zeta toxin family protein n=1 Tax=Pendulispora rubella TaxID=2741070 RepID=A0ABZ2L340_9BACT